MKKIYQPPVKNGMTRGVYMTSYGNPAYVAGPHVTTAWDIQMQERIPISEVNPRRWLRKAERGDAPSHHSGGGIWND